MRRFGRLWFTLGFVGVLPCCTPPFTSATNESKVMRPLGVTDGEEPTKLRTAIETVNASYFYLLGEAAMRRERWDDAIHAFEAIRAVDPESPYLNLTLGRVYLKAGRVKEAVASVRKAIELDPKDRDAQVLLASLYVTAQRRPEALVLLRQLVAQEPDDEEALLQLIGLEIENTKDLTTPRKRLEAFVKRNSESAVANFYLGRVQQEMGQRPAAIASYRKALDCRAGFSQAASYLGFLLEESGKRAEALAVYRDMADQYDVAAFQVKVGQMYLEDHKYDEALTSFQSALRSDPDDLNAAFKSALLLLEMKRPKEAVRSLERVLRANTESDQVRHYLGIAYEESGRSDLALAEYAKVPRASRYWLEGLRRRVAILSAKQSVEAWRLLETELESAEAPASEELFEAAVQYLDSAKRDQDAWHWLEKGLQRHASSESLLYLKGTLLEKQGRTKEAVTVVERLLAKNPNHAPSLNFVAYLWAERGERLPEAEKHVRRALALRPGDAFITDSLGWILYKRGNFTEAYKVLKTAHESRPEESVIADHLGDVLVKLGRLEEARGLYEKALALGPEKDADRRTLEAKLSSLPHHTSPTSADAGVGGVRDDAARKPSSTTGAN